MTRCTVCGRPLRRAESIAAGIGPWCKHTQLMAADSMSAEELHRLAEQRRYEPAADYREVFRFPDTSSLRQLRLDLLDAIQAGDLLTVGSYEAGQQRTRDAINTAIQRAETYGGASLQMVAMLAIIGIEHYTRKECESCG